jgi:hypothetical protein
MRLSFLGVGEKDVAVPFDAIHATQKDSKGRARRAPVTSLSRNGVTSVGLVGSAVRAADRRRAGHRGGHIRTATLAARSPLATIVASSFSPGRLKLTTSSGFASGSGEHGSPRREASISQLALQQADGGPHRVAFGPGAVGRRRAGEALYVFIPNPPLTPKLEAADPSREIDSDYMSDRHMLATEERLKAEQQHQQIQFPKDANELRASFLADLKKRFPEVSEEELLKNLDAWV